MDRDVQSGSQNERQERLQRIRIGITGLAVVFLVVLSAGALTNSASDELSVDQNGELGQGDDLPALIGNSLSREPLPQEPLVELGVTPSTGSENGTASAKPANPANAMPPSPTP